MAGWRHGGGGATGCTAIVREQTSMHLMRSSWGPTYWRSRREALRQHRLPGISSVGGSDACKDQDAKELAARSKRYSSLFNEETGFFQPKNMEGRFARNFDPIAWRDGFTEASAWQYRFDVPHDVDGLNRLFKVGRLSHGLIIRGGAGVVLAVEVVLRQPGSPAPVAVRWSGGTDRLGHPLHFGGPGAG